MFNGINKFSKILRNVEGKGFFHLLLANFFIQFIGFGSQLLVAKFLSPLELGQIKIMQSFIAVTSIFAGFGFNTSILKICAENRSLEQKQFIFKKNCYYSALPTLFVILVLFMLAKLQLLSPDKTVNKWMSIFVISIPAAVYTALIMFYLQALKQIKIMAKMQTLIRLMGFVILIVVTYLFKLSGFIFSSITIGYLAMVPLVNLVKGSFKSIAKVKNVFKESFNYAKWGLLANAACAVEVY
ncbi:MAG: oligosaccharide flippase family protein, partial [Candidatus Margulisbacteria bacterium]|nr:oligosaccharide flippase family protein [Candidatus Margulisiibacteriota bacterium]